MVHCNDSKRSKPRVLQVFPETIGMCELVLLGIPHNSNQLGVEKRVY